MNFPSFVRSVGSRLVLSGFVIQDNVHWRLFSGSGPSNFPKLKPVPAEGIPRAVDDLHGIISRVSLVVGESDKYAATAVSEMVEHLRQQGVRLTKALFGSSAKKLESLLRDGSIAKIDFHEPVLGCNFPIEFCCFGTGEDAFFLGDKCVVVRIPKIGASLPSQQKQQLLRHFLPPRKGKRAVGYAEDDRLQSACARPGKPLREEHEEIYALGHIVPLNEIDHLRELSASADRNREQFAVWLSRRRDVFHFNSETQDVGSAADRSRALYVRRKVAFRSEDIDLKPEMSVMESDTLVFINACGSAYGAMEYEGSIATKFLQLHAAAVCCTIGVVNDRLALEFAHEFYRALQDKGRTVVEAMLAARLTINSRHNHPLANLYTIVGNDNYSLRSA